ncbi:unnamed protein product [Effrenium voratum]|uniref:Uncharacterized protein n=1 Tax=Effrenium voratum TaxID=2562239 RepID=A0AA36J2F4_9DINO|nr:unnamed protein product [Effrenium voratum]
MPVAQSDLLEDVHKAAQRKALLPWTLVAKHARVGLRQIFGIRSNSQKMMEASMKDAPIEAEFPSLPCCAFALMGLCAASQTFLDLAGQGLEDLLGADLRRVPLHGLLPNAMNKKLNLEAWFPLERLHQKTFAGASRLKASRRALHTETLSEEQREQLMANAAEFEETLDDTELVPVTVSLLLSPGKEGKVFWNLVHAFMTEVKKVAPVYSEKSLAMARLLFIAAVLSTSYAVRNRDKEAIIDPEYDEFESLESYEHDVIHELEEVDGELPEHDDRVVPLRAEVQVAHTLDDIPWKSKLTFTMSEVPAGLSFVANLRATNESASTMVASAMRKVINVTLPPHFSSLCKIATVQSQIFITIGPLEMHQEDTAALDTFLMHFGHVEFSEYQNVDWKELMSNLTEETNLLEKLYSGMKFMLNATLTTGLEHAIAHVVKAHSEPEYEQHHEYPVVKVEEIDPWTMAPSGEKSIRTNVVCFAHESPCTRNIEGDCCDTSGCLLDPEMQCQFNFTSCMAYCMPDTAAPLSPVAEKLAGLFAGVSTSLRVAYDEETRQELMHMLPPLGMRYGDITHMSAMTFHHLPATYLGSPPALALADLVNVLDGIESFESLELLGLPVKAKMTMTSESSPFPLLAKLLKDSELIEILQNKSDHTYEQHMEHFNDHHKYDSTIYDPIVDDPNASYEPF